MVDLSTRYLGLELRSPLVASAGPLSQEVDNLCRMEDTGMGAAVLQSLFEEQIDLDSQYLDRGLSAGTESFAESLTYFPDMSSYNVGPEGYLEHIHRAKQKVKMPIIASLNGTSTGGWIRYAKWMEEAGADALELNIYYLPTDPDVTGAAIEDGYCDLVRHVRAGVSIPLSVKLGPYFSSIPNMARRLVQAGARGLVLFNRFYQPDFDLDTLEVVPELALSSSTELLSRLHWVAILYGKIRTDLAITGGVQNALHVLKSMMAGAKVAMVTSVLLRRGIPYAAEMERDLRVWMEEHEYESIMQMQGSMSYQSVPDPAAFERSNYMKVLSGYALKARVG